MLESKLHAHFLNWFNLYDPTPFKDLIKRGLGQLVYLFLPEDTSETGRSQNDLLSIKASSPRSTVKVLFWVVVSVSITLAVGQL